MRLLKIAFGATLCSLVLLVMTVSAADVAKIGVFKFQRFFEMSEAGKKANEEITKKGKKMEGELKEKGEELQKLKDRLDRERMVMSKETLEDKVREYRIQLNDLKTYEKKYSVELRKINQDIILQMQEKILGIIEELGKKEGYLMIVSDQAVLYSPSTIDVTDKIIQMSNSRKKQ